MTHYCINNGHCETCPNSYVDSTYLEMCCKAQDAQTTEIDCDLDCNNCYNQIQCAEPGSYGVLCEE